MWTRKVSGAETYLLLSDAISESSIFNSGFMDPAWDWSVTWLEGYHAAGPCGFFFCFVLKP